jgi:hypothetical protein
MVLHEYVQWNFLKESIGKIMSRGGLRNRMSRDVPKTDISNHDQDSATCCLNHANGSPETEELILCHKRTFVI